MNREAEKQRQYRELVLIQAEETKQARAEQEERKRREEEESKRQAEESRKKRMVGGDYVPTFMKPLGSKIQRSPEDEILMARVKDAEKTWILARAKLKAEMVRLEESLRKRERAAKRTAALTAGLTPNVNNVEEEWISASTLKDPNEFREALRKLKQSTMNEKNDLNNLERLDAEAKGWYDKAVTAMENADARERERERQEAMPVARSTTISKRTGMATNSTSTPTGPLSSSSSTRTVRTDLDVTATGGGGDELSVDSPVDGNSRRRTRDLPLPPHNGPTSPLFRQSSSVRSPRVMTRSPGGSHRSRSISPSENGGSKGGSRTSSRPTSRQVSRPGSRGQSPTRTPRSRRMSGEPDQRRASMPFVESAVADDGSLSPSHGDHLIVDGDVDPAADPSFYDPDALSEPIVNERTIAIDQARAKMMSVQADFEARIKALTSFNGTNGGTKKKGNKKASTKAK